MKVSYEVRRSQSPECHRQETGDWSVPLALPVRFEVDIKSLAKARIHGGRRGIQPA